MSTTKQMTPEEQVWRDRARVTYNRYAGIIIVPLLFIAAYAFYLHTTRSDIVAENYTLKNKFDSAVQQTKHLTSKDSLDVADNIALRAQNEGAIKEISETAFKLQGQVERNVKAIQYFAKIQQKMTAPSVIIHYDTANKIPLVAPNRSDSIAVPQSFSLVDTNLSLTGRITKAGVSLDSPTFFNTVYLRGGTRKYGFLNMRREDFVQAFNSNRYIKNTGIAEIHLKKKPSAWSRWIKPTLAATGAAVATGYLLKR